MFKCIHAGRLVLVGMLIGICGCPASSDHHTYPEDPLFVNKTPIELDAKAAQLTQPAGSEPEAPAPPHMIDVVRKKYDQSHSPIKQVTGTMPHSDTSAPRASLSLDLEP